MRTQHTLTLRYLAAQDLLISAGADASIKLWHLADWLPGSSSHAHALPALPAVSSSNSLVDGLKSGAGIAKHAQHEDARQAKGSEPSGSNPQQAQHGTSQHADAVLLNAKVLESQQQTTDKDRSEAAAISTEDAASAQLQSPMQQLEPNNESLARTTKVVDTMSSKSEWVRCMQLNQQSGLYVATNQGHVYSTQLAAESLAESSAWQHIYSSPSRAPVVCMHVLHLQLQKPLDMSMQANIAPQPQPPEQSRQAQHAQRNHGQQAQHSQQTQHAQHDKLILGDISGVVTVVQAATAQHRESSDDKAQQAVQAEAVTLSTAQQAGGFENGAVHASWTAHPGHPVLAVFGPKALPPGHVLTVSVSNTAILWWFVPALTHGNSGDEPQNSDPGTYGQGPATVPCG